MIRAELLTIGNEILQGKVLNRNAQYFGLKLNQMGIEVVHQASCRDTVPEIVASLRQASERADLVLMTGGLGPTPDDVTREAVATFFNTSLIFNAAQYHRIVQYFKKSNREPYLMTRREAYFPKIGVPILNTVGIALGFFVRRGRKLYVCLPGVPREAEHLFEQKVRKLILKIFGQPQKTHELVVSIVGMDESQVMTKLGKSFFRRRVFEFGSYPGAGRIVLRLKTANARLCKTLERDLFKKLGSAIYATKEVSLEEVVAGLLKDKRESVAVAESCTGGMLAKRLTDVAGASEYFKGSVVAYSNEVKCHFLGVPASTVNRYGAVSRQVAFKMADGVRQKFCTSIGVSITGVAGPSGGTRLKPVGLVWIGLVTAKKRVLKQYRFAGNRDRIRHIATQRALMMIRENV